MTRKKSSLSEMYTTGELNKLVDAVLHPLAKHNPGLMFLDGIIHSLIERNPRESAMKFVQYNLPKLVEVHEKSKAKMTERRFRRAK